MPKIRDLIQGRSKPFFSMEFFPPADPAQLPSFFDTVDKLAALSPLFASVTYGAGGKKQRNTLEITSQLASRGIPTMAHLTCVGASRQSLADFLDELEENGVNNVLALRGDAPKDADWNWDAGEFRHAADLVRFIRTYKPEMSIGVAAYPAPHPESPTFTLDRMHTAEKMRDGADFAVTQLFFDPREYLALRDSLQKEGIDKPVIPGILPIQSFEGLKRVLSLCGANIPARLYLELEKAQSGGGEDAMREAGLKFALELIRQLLDAGAPGIHLYTLNKSDLCEKIVRESGLQK